MDTNIFLNMLKGIMWILVWLLFFILFRFVYHGDITDWRKKQRIKSSLDILKERYTKGEIDKSTFDQMRKAIMVSK